MVFFCSEFCSQTHATIARHHTCGLGGNQLFPHYEDDFKCCLHIEGTADCCCQRTYCHVLYCTVLYCTVLYCTLLYYTSQLWIGTQICVVVDIDHVIMIVVTKRLTFLGKAHLKKTHPYLVQCHNRGGGSDRIPTSLTDLAK